MAALTLRNYMTHQCGLELWPPWLKTAAGYTRAKFMPDFWCGWHRSGSWTLRLIDAKCGGPDRFNVNARAHTAHLELAQFYQVPVLYVFSQGETIDATTFASHAQEGTPTERGTGKPYLFVTRDVMRSFDEVFTSEGFA